MRPRPRPWPGERRADRLGWAEVPAGRRWCLLCEGDVSLFASRLLCPCLPLAERQTPTGPLPG